MTKKKVKMTQEQLEKENELLRQQNLKLTIENEYLKKIECLSSAKRKPSKEEITRVITELRLELSYSLKFILDAIHANLELSQITRSDYYYQCKKIDKDIKNDEIMNQIISASTNTRSAMDTVESR